MKKFLRSPSFQSFAGFDQSYREICLTWYGLLLFFREFVSIKPFIIPLSYYGSRGIVVKTETKTFFSTKFFSNFVLLRHLFFWLFLSKKKSKKIFLNLFDSDQTHFRLKHIFYLVFQFDKLFFYYMNTLFKSSGKISKK